MIPLAFRMLLENISEMFEEVIMKLYLVVKSLRVFCERKLLVTVIYVNSNERLGDKIDLILLRDPAKKFPV